MSWGKLVAQVAKRIVKDVPRGGSVLDLCCGPGYLLGQIKNDRPDIRCVGVDLDSEFIAHARKRYPSIDFEIGDVLAWDATEKFDAIACTAGVHHIPLESQEKFIARMSTFFKEGGDMKSFAIVGDPYIGDYETESERQLASLELGCEYLAEAIRNSAPPDVVKAGIGILENDLLLVEWKTSVRKQIACFRRHFAVVEENHVWPIGKNLGDYYFVLGR